MNVVGKWKIKMVASYDPVLKMCTISVEDYIAKAEDEDEKAERIQFTQSTIEFTEDFKIIGRMPLPENVSEEELNAAIADGEITVDGDEMIISEDEWAIIDGKPMVRAGEEGDGDGNMRPHYEPLEMDGELLDFMGSLYERV